MGNTSPTPSSSRRPRTIEEFEKLYASALVSGHGQQTLSEGICNGMCLDWIRLLLHDAGSRFVDYGRLRGVHLDRVYALQQNIHDAFVLSGQREISEVLAHQRQLIRRQREAHVELQTIARPRARNAVVAEELLRIVGGWNAGSQHLDIVDSNSLRTAFRQQRRVADLRIERMTRLEDEIRRIEQVVFGLNRMLKDDERLFPHLFHRFRAKFHDLYQDQAYTFDDIEYMVAVNSTFSLEGVQSWLAEIRSCIHQLRDGHAALLNIRGDKGGHYVAFHRAGDQYSLFDPNTGWYRVTGADAVWEMFADLWFAAYLKSGYKRSSWRVYFWAPPVDPHLPFGHAIL